MRGMIWQVCHSVVRLEMLEDPFVSKTGLQWALSYAATDRNAGSSKKVLAITTTTSHQCLQTV